MIINTLWIICIVHHLNAVSAHIPVTQPTFRDGPVYLEAIENTTIWIPCNIDNLGENVVRWWRGEDLLADSSDHTHPRQPRTRVWANQTLEISNVQKEDDGQYICQIVRKEPWNPLQLSQKLEVLYPPEIFPEPTNGIVDVRLGQTTEIACFTKGMPLPKISWKTQDKEITNSGDKPHVLILEANSPKIAQIYRCSAENGIGETAHADFRVNVLYKPIAVADVSWLHAAPGLHAELVCRVSAEPTPRLQWFVNGEEIDITGSTRIMPYIQGQRHVLQFRNITADDFGIYSCRATNSEGMSEATVELSGRARPGTFKREVSRSNNSAILIWETDSYSPIIDFTLKFRQVPAPDDAEWVTLVVPADGQNPGPIHSKSYRLSGLQSASTYEAVVYSRNRYGLSSPSAPFLFSTEGADYLINGPAGEDSSEEDDSAEEDNAVDAKIQKNLKQLFISGQAAVSEPMTKTLITLSIGQILLIALKSLTN